MTNRNNIVTIVLLALRIRVILAWFQPSEIHFLGWKIIIFPLMDPHCVMAGLFHQIWSQHSQKGKKSGVFEAVIVIIAIWKVENLKSRLQPNTQKRCARFWSYCRKICKFNIETNFSHGGAREMDFLKPWILVKFRPILKWKIVRSQKSLFSWLTYTLCHNDTQNVLFPLLKPRESGRILYFRSKSPFFWPKSQTALSQPYFWSQSQTLYGIMYPMIGSIDFATKLKITPKILFRYSADFNEQHS